MAATKPKVEIIWPNPPAPRAVHVRTLAGGRRQERVLGPRARLTIEEAAELLGRPAAGVRELIRKGFVRSVRHGGRRYVTLGACAAYVREVIADVTVARARRGQHEIPAEDVFREAGV